MVSTTVVVAREFSGQRLFLVSAEAGAFCWSNDRAKALPVSVDVARRIIIEAQAWQSDAFAIDKHDNVIVPAVSGAAKALPVRHYHNKNHPAWGYACGAPLVAGALPAATDWQYVTCPDCLRAMMAVQS